MRMGDGRRWARYLALLTLVGTIVTAGVGPAFATPVDEYLGLSDLQTMLDSSPDGAPIQGYLKTVLKGSTISTIPVEVIATTSDSLGASNATKALIIFEAKGPIIESLGGIASGMSGSPIYVDDGSGDKVIGALSYGNWFSKNGAGIATPIEAMLEVADYPTDASLTMSALEAPAATSAGLIKDVVITSDPGVAAAARGKYTLVAKPYSLLSIGSLAPASKGYKQLAELAARRGYEVHPLSGTLGTSKSSWSTTITPGAGLAALASWGDFWMGGIGTATYVDSDTVLAFGHPMDWSGASNYAMANAWIDYVWGSDVTPYKVGRPGLVRGTVTQDRGAAILGRSDIQSKTTTITSHVTETSTGNDVSGVSYMPRAFATGDWSMIPGYAAYETALRACDDYAYKGSALTTTTIVVTDGTETYTVVRPNIWNGEYDVAFDMVDDPFMMVYNFNGVDKAQVLSVDFESALDPDYVDARIVDVTVPDGLKAGSSNTVRVSLLERGNPVTKTVDVQMPIPVGTPSTGRMVVSGGQGYYGDYYYDEESYMDEYYEYEEDLTSQTTSEVAAALQAEPLNSDLSVSFTPLDPKGIKRFKAIEATAATPWYLTGYSTKSTARFSLMLDETTVNYNTMAMLMGEVEGINNDSTLSVYGRSVDSTVSKLLGTVDIKPDEDGMAEFEQMILGLKKNTELNVRFSGDEDTLRTDAFKTVKVRAAIRLTPSARTVKYGKKVKLTATLAPGSTAGKVVFQRYRSGKWRTIATKRIYSGKAAVTFTPAEGKNKVRARYLGGTVNAARTSYTKTVTAR